MYIYIYIYICNRRVSAARAGRRSLGVMTYQMLAGVSPFKDEALRPIDTKVFVRVEVETGIFTNTRRRLRCAREIGSSVKPFLCCLTHLQQSFVQTLYWTAAHPGFVADLKLCERPAE